MRGLKYLKDGIFRVDVHVAPHVGAWIEITTNILQRYVILVAPHVGAWIEIINLMILMIKQICRTSRRCVD